MTPAPSTPAARFCGSWSPPLGKSSGQICCLEPRGSAGAVIIRCGVGCVPGLLATHALVPRVTWCSVALVYVGMEFGKRESNPTLKERVQGEEEGCGRALKSLARNLNMAQARRAGASGGVWDGPCPGAHLPQPRMLGTWPSCPPLLSLAEAPG